MQADLLVLDAPMANLSREIFAHVQSSLPIMFPGLRLCVANQRLGQG